MIFEINYFTLLATSPEIKQGEIAMDNIKTLNKRYEAVAWGLIFLLIGGFSLVPGDQTGLVLLGVGIIFLGLNLVRNLNGIPVNWFSITLGLLALALGIVVMLLPLLNIPPFELPFFSIMLVVFGLYLLIPAPKQMENK